MDCFDMNLYGEKKNGKIINRGNTRSITDWNIITIKITIYCTMIAMILQYYYNIIAILFQYYCIFLPLGETCATNQSHKGDN